MVDIAIEYEGDLRTRAAHAPSSNELVTDAPVDNQGRGESFSPTDLVATAAGSCMATIMGIVARDHDIDLKGMKVHVRKEMVADPRRRIARLVVTFDMPRALPSEHKTRLENAARTCPVMESIHPAIEVPVEFRYPDPA